MNDEMLKEALRLAREAIDSHHPHHCEYKIAAALISLHERAEKFTPSRPVAWAIRDGRRMKTIWLPTRTGMAEKSKLYAVPLASDEPSR